MNRTALITGSSRGIGKEIALSFSRKGYNLIINYKDNERAAKETFNEVSKFCNCLLIRADISKTDEVDRLFNEAAKKFGFIDTVINNAGVAMTNFMLDVSETEYDYIMDTNLKGTFFVSKAFLPKMIENKFGRIINISSILGTNGASCEVAYSASKAGIIGLTKALSKEVGGIGITVNAITPGLIDTDMIKDLTSDDIEALIKSIAVGRIGKPADIAPTVAFLASEEAVYINGQILGIDGNFVI